MVRVEVNRPLGSVGIFSTEKEGMLGPAKIVTQNLSGVGLDNVVEFCMKRSGFRRLGRRDGCEIGSDVGAESHRRAAGQIACDDCDRQSDHQNPKQYTEECHCGRFGFCFLDGSRPSPEVSDCLIRQVKPDATLRLSSFALDSVRRCLRLPVLARMMPASSLGQQGSGPGERCSST